MSRIIRGSDAGYANRSLRIEKPGIFEIKRCSKTSARKVKGVRKTRWDFLIMSFMREIENKGVRWMMEKQAILDNLVKQLRNVDSSKGRNVR